MASTVSRATNQARFATDSQTVASQHTTISQLTDMVSEVQQENKTIMSRFDKLNEQIAALLTIQTSSSTHQRPAGGHDSESGRAK